MRTRMTVAVVLTVAGGLVARHYLSGVQLSYNGSVASSLGQAVARANAPLPPPVTASQFVGMAAGWNFGDARVGVRAGGIGAIVNTTTKPAGYQLVSPVQSLPSGSYFAAVRGRVARGGMEVGVLDQQTGKWIATGLFGEDGSTVVIPVGFTLTRATPVQIILSNYSPGDRSSTWDLSEAGIYPGSVTSLLAPQVAAASSVRGPPPRSSVSPPGRRP